MAVIPFVEQDVASDAVPIWPVEQADYEDWLGGRSGAEQRWLRAAAFKPEAGRTCLLPDGEGGLAGVVLGLGKTADMWCYGDLAGTLPPGRYAIDAPLQPEAATGAALAWALGTYRFTRYAGEEKTFARLTLPAGADGNYVAAATAGSFLARELINTPAADMGPAELAEAATTLAERHGASCSVLTGDELLMENYPSIHAVGRASINYPRLIDLNWGDTDSPRVTLVGKGVCFDTGGLDLKSAAGMLKMKKDMGGAATMLGLASMIMQLGLPVRLRLLIPAVENAVSGSAYRPGDVLSTRKGLTVEVGNTDAEGRIVLSDALAEADSEQPALLIDCATLTGAARVALGPDLPAYFTDSDDLAAELERAGAATGDPLWRLPLHEPYRERLKSRIADMNNVSEGPFAGALTAALFLKSFVTETRDWVHIDTYAWNDAARPGRPPGGEGLTMRALYRVIAQRFGG